MLSDFTKRFKPTMIESLKRKLLVKAHKCKLSYQNSSIGSMTEQLQLIENDLQKLSFLKDSLISIIEREKISQSLFAECHTPYVKANISRGVS